METAKRASALIVQTSGAARQVSASTGHDVVMQNDAADQIPQILREHFAPVAPGTIHREAVRLFHFRRTGQTMRVFLVEFNALRREEES